LTHELAQLQHPKGLGISGKDRSDAMADNDLWGLLYILAGEDPNQELSPFPDKNIGMAYMVDGITVPEQRIKRLAEKNLLDIVNVVSFGCCPSCNGMHLSTIMRCPSCLKQSLSKVELVVHYECGHLAPLQEVAVPGSSEYACPNCSKKMKRVGIDYGRPGLGFRCLSCREVSQYPHLMLVCEKGHEFKIDEQELRVFPIYKVGEGLQTMPRIMSQLTAVKNLLAKEERECVLLAQVKGMSGATYIAPLLIPGIPSILVDFLLDDSSWEFQVLQAIKKSVDLNARALLVVKDHLLEVVKDMVNPDRINVVAFTEESEIPELVATALVQMGTNPTPLPQPKFEAHKGIEPN
jgi:hypothetical protein